MLYIFVAKCRREEILDVIKRCFYIKKQQNLPMFYTTSKNLREFTTTENDMKKEISKFPTPNYRTNEEDLFDESSGAQASSTPSIDLSMNTDTSIFNNRESGEAELAAQQALRGK